MVTLAGMTKVLVLFKVEPPPMVDIVGTDWVSYSIVAEPCGTTKSARISPFWYLQRVRECFRAQ
jgi:hypothetical protein